MEHSLRRVYWEITAGCNLRCLHCRRLDVLTKSSPDELTTDEGKRLVDELAHMGRPVLIFSGGEPLFRRDIFDLISYANSKSLPVALSTNGTLVDARMAKKIKDAGVYYASVSLDGAKPATHDKFRGKGNFERAIRGMMHLQNVGIKVQINFTVTKQNVEEIDTMYQMAASLRAYALYLFLLVPVGCGVAIANTQMLDVQEVEAWLGWILKKDKEGSLPIKAICAPHYYRIESETRRVKHVASLTENGDSPHAGTVPQRKGCLAGIHMCFVSHKGEVFPCGYLPVCCGNVKQTPFLKIWEESSEFANLRDPEKLKGRCGACPFKIACGGCRARAYYAFNDFLQEEPYCVWQPVNA